MIRSDQGCRSTTKAIGINQTPNQDFEIGNADISSIYFQSTSIMQATQNSVYEKKLLHVAVQVI